MKKIFCVISIARQIDGEYILIRAEKGYSDPKKATDKLCELKENFQKNNKNNVFTINTPQGDVDCFCEFGVFDLEIEE